MSYTDILLAKKLSGGGGGGILKCTITDGDNDDKVLDKTYADLEEAFNAGKTIIAVNVIETEEQGGAVLVNDTEIYALGQMTTLIAESMGYEQYYTCWYAYIGSVKSTYEFGANAKDDVLSTVFD